MAKIRAPKIKAPRPKRQKTKKSKAKKPKIKKQKAKKQKVRRPKVKLPKTKRPKVKRQKAKKPKIKKQKVKKPRVRKPKVKKPKIRKPRKQKQKKEKPQPVIIKLGGSVITKKDSPKTLSTHLPRIVREIRSAIPSRLVIVHGGGSFGHHAAGKYGVQNGSDTRPSPEQLIGFAETQQAMEELNNHVVGEFLEAGLPAFPLQLSSLVMMENGRIKTFPIHIIRRALSLGLVPVLYGVPAFDTKKKFCILSGDEIVQYLAKKLHASTVVLASDVDGVMTADPKVEKAELIKTVSNKNVGKLKLLSSGASDVTGGMLRKVQELLSLASAGIESEIINATVPGNLKRALKGEKVGTTIKQEPHPEKKPHKEKKSR